MVLCDIGTRKLCMHCAVPSGTRQIAMSPWRPILHEVRKMLVVSQFDLSQFDSSPSNPSTMPSTCS